jgi:hypothetical protein
MTTVLIHHSGTFDRLTLCQTMDASNQAIRNLHGVGTIVQYSQYICMSDLTTPSCAWCWLVHRD